VSELKFLRAYRLSQKADISNVFQSGKKRRSPELSVFFYPNQHAHPRLCTSVSKKSVSKSYLRNQIKRIVRESFRLNQHDLPSYDIVIVVYKPMGLLDKKQMREVLTKQWQKLMQVY
jgi:ribonuclease P protein component